VTLNLLQHATEVKLISTCTSETRFYTTLPHRHPTCKAMHVAHMRLAHNVLLIYIQRKLKGAILPILERCRNRLF
jgi:hypothetical protein